MFYLPNEIKNLIGEEKYSLDDVGMSDSTIVLFRDKILKIQTMSEESLNEYHMMEWLKDKVPVPKVLGFERDEHKNYLLMTKVTGEMSCADKYLKNPEQLTAALAEALQKLWKVDISNCPYIYNLDKKLQMAKYNVENNLVDMDDVESGTFGENGFKNPYHLLEWLINNKPEEELVLSHGDFCLPNIFLSNGKVSGYIDLGMTGIADKWQDIALCYRSLLHNYEGKFTGMPYQGFNIDMLFEKLEIEPNWDKIRYYILLDELF
jgi:aminoglycoside phosphotransferase